MTATTGEVVGLVEQDVRAGFESWLPAAETGGGFAVDPAVAEGRALDNEAAVALAWTWVGDHLHEHAGLMPTGHRVVVKGITVVSDGPGGEPGFQRYVDWAHVYAQLGLVLAANALAPADRARPQR